MPLLPSLAESEKGQEKDIEWYEDDARGDDSDWNYNVESGIKGGRIC